MSEENVLAVTAVFHADAFTHLQGSAPTYGTLFDDAANITFSPLIGLQPAAF